MAKKRADGRYKVSVTIDGKRKYFVAKTLKEANARKKQYIEMSNAAPHVNNNIKLSQWLGIWLHGAKNTLAKNTFASYVYQLKHYILPTMGKIKLIELQPYMFRQLITNLLAKGYSNRSVHYACAVVRIALRQAVNDGLLPRSPLQGVTLPKVEKTQVLALTKEESQKLLSVIDTPKHYNLYWIALYTGLRRSELLGLRISDIDNKRNTITVAQTVLNINNEIYISPTTKNSSSNRTISVDGKTMNIIRKQIAITYQERMKSILYKNNDLLFAKKDGSPYDPKYITRTAKKYGEKAGLPKAFTFHTLRHTHATLLVKAGVHFKIIQHRLGHATFQQTMDTYSHIIPDIEEQIVDTLEHLIS